MPKIYINNEKIEAENGETVIQAAYRNGIEIPHFCWHPELAVVGNCRMCLVEVGLPKRNSDGSYIVDAAGNYEISFMSKLQIACNTLAAEEMRILTKSPKVVKAQEAVMEFMLINHPLDCPICDEAGNCKLQKYAQNYSTGVSRFEEKKNKNPKRVEWNDKIMYDAERCISCGRCIRITRDINKEDVLTFVNRGDKVRVERFADAKLTNNYSMNVIDSCPVGALTSRDFRFKARVWEMSFTDSICPGCSRGCNIKIGVKNGEILRFEPRRNVLVNKDWMCDTARLSQYKFVNESRILSPFIGGLRNSSWKAVIDFIVAGLRKFKSNEIFFLASPFASNESNYLLDLLAKQAIKSSNIAYIPRIDATFGDDFLRRNDRTPNVSGLEAFDITTINISSLSKRILAKEIKALYILDENFNFYDGITDNSRNELVAAMPKLDFLVIHAHNSTPLAVKYADIVLPATTFAEMEGTFTNFEKRVQHFSQAINVTGIYRENASRLEKFGSHNDKWNQSQTKNLKSSWWILQEIAKAFCSMPKFENSEDVFNEISKNIKDFSGMNYKNIIENGGILLNSKV